MKNFCVKLVFIFFIFLHYQCNSKKAIQGNQYEIYKYYDQESNEISKSKFKGLINYAENIDIYLVKDSIRKGYIVDRKMEGKFSEDQFNFFKSQLISTLGIEIPFTEPLRFVCYLKISEQSSCLEQTRNLKYAKKVDEDFVNFKNYHIASSNYEFDSAKFDVLVDKQDVLKQVFEQFTLNCVGYLILLPDGSYSTCIGDGCEYFGIRK